MLSSSFHLSPIGQLTHVLCENVTSLFTSITGLLCEFRCNYQRQTEVDGGQILCNAARGLGTGLGLNVSSTLTALPTKSKGPVRIYRQPVTRSFYFQTSRDVRVVM